MCSGIAWPGVGCVPACLPVDVWVMGEMVRC